MSDGKQVPAMSKEAEPFLTEAQRAALDAALEAKVRAKSVVEAGTSGSHVLNPRVQRKHGAVHVKPMHGAAGDRKKSSFKNGEAKKKGAGGKYTWGAMLSETQLEPAALDKNDPNYDSEQDVVVREVPVSGNENAVQSDEELGEDEFYESEYVDPMYRTNSKIVKAVAQLKQDIMVMLKEYLESGDVDEAAACIAELQLPQYDYYIVKRAVTLAMDRREREREAVSVLLSNLYGQYITPQQMQKGFVSVLEDFDELILDVPDAVEVMSLFVCRAIVDDILPPSFVSRILPPSGSPLEALKSRCQMQLGSPHSAERMLRCWGADATLTLQEGRERIKAMLAEYLTGGDFGEVERQLRSLDAPFFHHEVVKQALLIAADDMSHAKDRIVDMLARLTASNEISSAQIYKGFQRLEDQLQDLTLDSPSLPAHFDTLRDACISRGVIDPADATLLHHEMDRRRSCESERPHSVNGSVGVRSVPAFKVDMLRTLQEYFDSADVSEVKRILEECEEVGMMHLFVKLAFTLALERSNRERELISQLFVVLVPGVIAAEQFHMGFQRLLAACDDTVLDVPDAVHLLTLFLARLIVDEVLPPAYLTAALDAVKADSLAVVVIRNAGRLLSVKHGAERVLQCWEGGQQSLEKLNSNVSMLLKEYLINPDKEEVQRCLHDLHARYYHHEVVRQILVRALEEPSSAAKLVELLKHLSVSGAITETQMAKGFKRVLNGIQDYELDYPHARSVVDNFVSAGQRERWLLLDASAA